MPTIVKRQTFEHLADALDGATFFINHTITPERVISVQEVFHPHDIEMGYVPLRSRYVIVWYREEVSPVEDPFSNPIM